MAKRLDCLTQYFPNCRRILEDDAWERILAALGDLEPSALADRLKDIQKKHDLPGWLPDAASIEFKFQELSRTGVGPTAKAVSLAVNPELALVPVQWRYLPDLMGYGKTAAPGAPEEKAGHVLIWRHPETSAFRCRDAVDDDLLALKLVVEDIDIREAARAGNSTLAKILAVLHRGVKQGLLMAPESRVRRDPAFFSGEGGLASFLETNVFTLQWHITQACDLHCRHCYDRSDRSRMPFSRARSVLDDFFDFTRAMNVRGHVTFTGGNPLLYPEFYKLYQRTADMGFSTAILGNPAHADILDILLAIQPLTHYQISLEGLESYNDYIRGKGHFKRSLTFLDLLREKGIYSMVMLTLNRDNMDQVLPLADLLKGRADGFTFNRLAMVGEGKNLSLPDPEAFQVFLKSYVDAASANPFMTLKDNLFNILKKAGGLVPGGGCTGYGCGAAFNFVSLLPDGEVHACRKFPSIIGNIKENSLIDIYNSLSARQYRKGTDACGGCDLYTVCRGCPAVVHGMGLDCFKSRDPFCFYSKAPGGKA